MKDIPPRIAKLIGIGLILVLLVLRPDLDIFKREFQHIEVLIGTFVGTAEVFHAIS